MQNNAANYGGAIDGVFSNIEIVKSIIVGNSAEKEGGGIYLQNENEIVINHATIADNVNSGLIGDDENLVSEIKNSIFWGNGEMQHSTIFATTYSVVENGTTENGNIVNNPLFKSDGTYGLQETSPCIDKGCETGSNYLGSAPDIGALELQ